MRHARTALLLIAGVTFGVTGCSQGGDAGPDTPGVVKSSAALHRAQSCDDLTSALREDARSKMNRRIDAEIRAVREGYPWYGYYGAPGGVVVADGAVPNAGVPMSAPGNSNTSPLPAHSETETQVKGVDEADIVKADGTRLYVLHGGKFLIVNAWPAPNLALAGGIDIEGSPGEMFVANGRAVIFSSVEGAAVYAAAGLTPKPSYSDAYGPNVSPSSGLADVAGPGVVNGGGLTKVTVLALDGGNATVLRESYFEGSYLSSRRVGNRVRLVLGGGAHGPVLDYAPAFLSNPSSGFGAQLTTAQQQQQIADWESVRAKNEATIAATTYSDWVPIAFSKESSGMQRGASACGDFYVPTAGSTEFGMTQIVAFDLDALASPPLSVGIVGAAQTVYGDADSMVLAGRAYVDPWTVRQAAGTSATGSASSPDAAIPVATLNYTHLHLFDVASAAGQPLYVGSGTVPGDVNDQFAIDQKQGRVRVTTTEQRSGPARSDGKLNAVSHVYVLENESSELVVVGDAGEIAPGERLYATRYVGDKAYIVTWHVVDPLFVIDLADPRKPTVLGELKIPGFSEYMRPLDDTHLLTIGRETDETGHQHTDEGYWYGLSLQIFDVTDPLKPALAHKYLFGGGDYGTSEATQNHKAFTYFEDRKLLAFPYVRQSWSNASVNQGPSSTLEIFRVDVESGFQKLGSVDHSALLGTTQNGNYGYCGGYFDGSVRRGVFFEDVVYSISYGGVLANDVSNLTSSIAQLKLAAPNVQGLACQ